MTINPLKFYKQWTDGFKAEYSKCPVDHGWSHIVDVVLNAQSVCMANNVPYTREIELSCILHDLGNSVSRDRHHEISAMMVPDVLEKLGIPTNNIDVEDIQNGCRYHRASEKEDISGMSMTVKITSASDRMRPSTNREDILRDVYWRAIQYSMTHDEEVEDTQDPIYSGFKWVYDTYTTDNARSAYYSDLYRNTFEKQLIAQKNLVAEITLDEVREWCKREKGIGAEITLS